MTNYLRTRVGVLAAGLFLAVGCGDEGGDDGAPAAGGLGTSGTGGAVSATGGSTTGGAGTTGGATTGGANTGGATSGGTTTGGANTGGANTGSALTTGGTTTGGTTTGGATTGGATTGGTTTGGATTGGATTGGATTGGTSTGGAPGTGGSSTGGSGGSDAGWRTSCKRGVAYGHHSDADLTALSSAVAWWYNWAFLPDSELSPGTYAAERVEYVPMIWGAGTDRAAAQSQIPDGSTTLLGFNEPNFYAQANLSAADAAALWPSLEAIADARGLRLVAPALNYCGGGCHDTDPFAYLRDFFAACPGCRVDAIGVHIYVGCAGSGEDQAAWLIDHLNNWEAQFSQPIWLTEFACDDAANAAEQQAFMEDAVAHLEADPRVERYAWFAGRADNVPYVDLLGADGELTALGQAYVAAPASGDCAP